MFIGAVLTIATYFVYVPYVELFFVWLVLSRFSSVDFSSNLRDFWHA